MNPGSHSANRGKNSTSNSPTTSGRQKIAEPRKICVIGTSLSSAFITDMFMPTDGEIRPTCTTRTIRTPNHTGSKPSAVTTGRNTGMVNSTIVSSSMMVPSTT